MRTAPLGPLGVYLNAWDGGLDGWFGLLVEGGRSQGDGQESSSIHMVSLALKRRNGTNGQTANTVPAEAAIDRIDTSEVRRPVQVRGCPISRRSVRSRT